MRARRAYIAAATLALWLGALSASAQTVVVTGPVRARQILTMADLAVIAETIPGTFSDPAELAGQEARVNLYPNRPVRRGDVGPPALIERNQSVTMIYSVGGLTITTEGRALGRAGVGERIKVMNTDSRVAVTGIVRADGTVEVGS